MSPFLVLVIGIAFIVLMIAVFRIHAFISLMLAAVLVGVLSPEIVFSEKDLPKYPATLVEQGAKESQASQAISLALHEFGTTASKIAIIIVLASIIGQCMMDSGAADMITRRFLRFLGAERSALALLGSAFVLSIPVFFDTVFFLLIPLAKSFYLRTKKHYAFYVMAICAGGVLTHSLVAPTPGPLIMAASLKLDLGVSIIAGILFGLPPAILGGWFFTRWLSARNPIPFRETPGTSIEELEEIVNRSDRELPPFWLSILPVVLPVVLIASWTIVKTLYESDPASKGLVETFRIVGGKELALLISTALSIYILCRQKGARLRDLLVTLEPAIATAGVIILITSAGGAFGGVLRHSGLSEAIQDWGTKSGPLMILLAFGIAAIMKTAQGSGTVAIITTAGIMYTLIQGKTMAELPFHPIYIFLAIGFGSKPISWMNDSGFWVVCKLSGFTQKETLKTWTVLLAVLGFIGLIEVLIFSSILPLKTLAGWDG